ncbi:MAG TPA: class I SAM-dependent methyltransferase [Phenylobacterium sp.]|uniref:Class I SAM-dependent methyltransferase n=1 Tax=Phenylobacterium conjunctum TaxID=1298959 RepID=A0ABW3SZ73_9CAUL|nr:class I SAM-dependent methyltransferase [Phenylobacterium sp.]HQN49942.1 class I SAM-dependent methyltransferase [Phenylobacterium sp.]
MLTVRFEKLGLKPGDWVLDLGCGEGRHVHGVHVIGGINVVGLDMDLPSLAKGREGLSMLPRERDEAVTAFLVGDAYRLPFPDAAFDAVICSEVLEHLHQYGDALAEIRRVLKPGGAFVPTVPRAWPERICWALAPGQGGYADQPGGHVRIFAAEALKADISRLGFRFLGQHFAHGLHSPYWWLKCAFWGRDHVLVRLYHRFLVWDLMQRPWLTRALEALANPIMGKSVAFYFRKGQAA